MGEVTLAEVSHPREADRQLASDVLTGDAEAFATLFHTYRQDVYRVACAIVGNSDLAFDVTQDVFIRVHQGLASWGARASLRTWILRIAIRCAIDYRRAARRQPSLAANVPDPSFDPRPSFDRELMIQQVLGISSRLSRRQSLLLRLRIIGELSNKEVAETLGLRESNIRVQLSKAIRRLRAVL
jgi:RNA polymerase sigma-70 factor (ECF subfamily)